MINLVWASKFRALLENKRLSEHQVITEYLKYCTKMEKEINERWKK